MHSTLFFVYPKYAILYIFKIVPVLLERIRNIHRIYLLLIKIMLEKRYRGQLKYSSFFSFEIITDFDLEPDIYIQSSFSFIQNIQFCIFSRFLQFYWRVNILEIHTEFC